MVRVTLPDRLTITVALIAIIFSLSLIGISNVKAQAPPSTGNQTTDQTQFSTYTDPQGRFSIKYPSTWDVKPATNRFETVQVGFISPPSSGSFAGLSITVPNVPGTDPGFYIRGAVPTLSGYSIFQEPECVKYKVDGQKACSVIVTKETSSGGNLVIMYVDSFVNGHMYLLGLAGTFDTFDKNLPLLEQMLASFKAPP